MHDDFIRETAPSGDSAKPPRKPPTAVAVATPPNPERHRQTTPRLRRSWIARVLSNTLDALDLLGDAVAEKLKLRTTH